MAELRVTSTGTIKLFESDDTSSVTIASPASLGGDRTITLPDANVDLTEVNTMPIANLDIDGGTDIGANIADSVAAFESMSDVDFEMKFCIASFVTADAVSNCKVSNSNVFNNGEMIRDFTYINDVVESIRRLIDKPAIASKDFDQDSPKSSISWAPHRIFNIGNSKPTQLMKYISVIEKCLNKKARINFMPMQMGDVKATYADTSSLESWIQYKPNTPIEEGVKNFVDWYLDFYKS